MIKNKNIVVILILSVLFVSCTDLIDPAQENIRDKNTTYDDPNFGLGLLTQGYARIPTNGWSFSEVATDDAVTNVSTNGYLRLATGQWSASNNPADRWTSCFSGIQYMNIVLKEVDKMTFAEDPLVDNLFKSRIKGEAYGLRALFMYHLLQAHAGWANGTLLGVPIYLTELDINSNYNVPRESFNACTAQIYSDINNAIELLPVDYVDVASTSSIPSRYNTPGMTAAIFNRAMGVRFVGLVSGRVAMAIRSQTALLAASPAYAGGSNGTWEDAAGYAAQIIALKGGLAGLPSTFNSGVSWYRNASEISALSAGSNSPESLWRGGTSNNNDLERDHFPPSLFGNGIVNPTQNLVDAFPASNGYPISNPLSNYSSSNPYANRDPRLNEFILFQGGRAGVTNAQVNLIPATNPVNQDAVNAVTTSTRTGYYLKKLLRQDVNYNPTGRNTQLHYRPRIRYTEIYLNYAEAANEAWGSVADPRSYGFTAYDIIKAIRRRALGITNDPYLESIKTDKVAMRELIRNERRLELSFEGFRFWDLRRWKVSLPKLNEPAMGITVSGTTASLVYSAPAVVEERVFQDYMYYGPIPYSETLKFNNLFQNDGWNN
ncbi:RagB/SusD family nutrient uptake outer membrane protein [Flavobacterium hibisci]|uniref:RagB/SusD family nutrient uptake outer membrane protein n=1 Tax=Flavobacterium hibisci TaxID=1914462 RepID=UPI001CBE9B31|nr:RagB/SusD family nutrient uptake outer membrane protein [Flavobacterium hibisci]MBZ4040828.1 RagB/SusD family nutrient uptake outer membrane protein [Flavobacterium hibisci]